MRMRWVGVVVLFPFLMSGAAYADGDGGQVGVILKAGEIDSSRVKAGAFAVVIHGQGKRHPVSGEWEHLDTARGYIRFVDWQQGYLILAARKERQLKSIALEGIQTMVIFSAEEPERKTGILASRRSAVRDSTWTRAAKAQAKTGNPFMSGAVKVDTSSPDLRVAEKLGIGALWGIVPSYASGLFLTFATGNTEGFGAGIILQFTVAFGYPLGVAVGVSRVDPYDRLIHSLAGSGVGLLANFYIPITYEFSAFDWNVIWNWFICPLVGATIASELGRDPNESRRFSIDVVPSPGSLSAVARLRF